MRPRTIGRRVARAVVVVALGLGVLVPGVALAANEAAGDAGAGKGIAEAAVVFTAFGYDWQ